MDGISNILIATDGSVYADAAVECGAWLASRIGAQVTAAYVIDARRLTGHFIKHFPKSSAVTSPKGLWRAFVTTTAHMGRRHSNDSVREGKQMLVVFTSSWWALVLRGIAAILFGVLAIVWPHITLTALVFLFGAYALVDGLFAIVAGVKAHGEFKRWWVLLLEGVFSVIVGVFAFALPSITAMVLLILIAAWAIVTGAFEIGAAIQLRKYITGEWLLVLAGLASVLFGFVVRSVQQMAPRPV